MNVQLIKKMLPGLIPLFVFILADEIWGTEIGIIVAVVFGISEFIFFYIKDGIIDKFIIFDTLLLTALGVISILLNNDIFFKLKPALIELILCILIGFSAFTSHNFIIKMGKRYFKELKISDSQQKMMKVSLKIFFWILLIHVMLIIYSAYFMSKEAWAFISGGLFYIIFAIYFIYHIIYLKLKQKKSLSDEILPIVDNKGKILGQISRTEAHNGSKTLHPVVHVHIINTKNQIWLQKRAENKTVQPGKWDTAVGGHISFGEKLETGLMREIYEEAGIKNTNPIFINNYIWESEIEKELVYLFILRHEKPRIINPHEVATGQFWSINEITKSLNKNIFTPSFIHEFPIIQSLISACKKTFTYLI